MAASSTLCASVASLLRSLPSLGRFPDGSDDLSRFEAHPEIFTKFATRRDLYIAAGNHSKLLACYERLLRTVVLPSLSQRLADALGEAAGAHVTFWCQTPPTVRVQPPDPHAHGREHNDAEYGHQVGEVNYWMPLTAREKTQTTLWVESAPEVGDFHPLDVDVGQIAQFHGTLCRHRAPPNASDCTRVSLDFRIGIQGEDFDPEWQDNGVRAQHSRREYRVEMPRPSVQGVNDREH